MFVLSFGFLFDLVLSRRQVDDGQSTCRRQRFAWLPQISPEGAASILGRYKDDAHKALQFPKDCQELATAQQIYAGENCSTEF